MWLPETHDRFAVVLGGAGALGSPIVRWSAVLGRPDCAAAIARTPLPEPAELVEAALKGGRAPWPGGLDVLHDLASFDAAVAACVLLGDSAETYGEVWHVPGAG